MTDRVPPSSDTWDDDDEITLPGAGELMRDPESRQAQVTLLLFKLSQSTGCSEGIEQAYSIGYRAGELAQQERSSEERARYEQTDQTQLADVAARSESDRAKLLARIGELEEEAIRLEARVSQRDIGAINNEWHAETMRKLKAETAFSSARALLERIVKYAREDRATTPGVTRLARVLADSEHWLAAHPESHVWTCISCGRHFGDDSACDWCQRAAKEQKT